MTHFALQEAFGVDTKLEEYERVIPFHTMIIRERKFGFLGLLYDTSHLARTRLHFTLFDFILPNIYLPTRVWVGGQGTMRILSALAEGGPKDFL
jgi:hypothetical protein